MLCVPVQKACDIAMPHRTHTTYCVCCDMYRMARIDFDSVGLESKKNSVSGKSAMDAFVVLLGEKGKVP